MLGLACAAAAIACGPEPLTEIVLVIQTDYAPGTEVDRIHVAFLGPRGAAPESDAVVAGNEDVPVTIGLTPKDPAYLGPILITATAFFGEEDLVHSRVSTSFESGQVRRLDMFLLKFCDTSPDCNDTTSPQCRPDECTDEEVTLLPVHDDVDFQECPRVRADGVIEPDRNGNNRGDVCEELGDMDCDHDLSFADNNPFVLALDDPAAYREQYPDCDIMRGDMNGDGEVNNADINPFVAALGEATG